MATRHISHLKSSGTTTIAGGRVIPKSPKSTDLVFGEIAINYREGYEMIAIKNSANNVVSFSNDNALIATMDSKDQAASAVTLNAAEAAAVSSAITKVIHDDTISGNTVLLNLSNVNASGRTLSAEVNLNRVVTRAESDITLFGDNNVMVGNGNTTIKQTTKDYRTLVTTQATGTTLTANKIIMGGGDKVVSASSYSVSTDMPTNTSSAETLVPSSKAVAQAIEESFKAQDAMRYKGTVSSVTDFNNSCKNPEVGDTWKVSKAFGIDGVNLEAGDMLISHISKTGETTANMSNFDAIQANLDPNLYALKTDIINATSDDDVVNISLGGNVGLSGYTLTASHKTAHTASGQTTPNTAQTLEKGKTVNVPVIKFDKYGHVTATTTTTIGIQDNIAFLAQGSSYAVEGNIIVGAGSATNGGIKDSSVSLNSVVTTPTTASTLTANKIIMGGGNKVVSASSYSVDTEIYMQSPSASALPTSKAVCDVIAANCISSVSASAPLSSYTSNGAVTISHNNSGVVANSYGEATASKTGGTITIPRITVDATGHITYASDKTYVTPNSYGTVNIYDHQGEDFTASTYNALFTFLEGDGIIMGKETQGDEDMFKISVGDIICGDY